MDLFNPPKLFNYNIMIKDLDFSKFENPSVQVVWEDLQENFTQDKMKSVKHYFQKKYNTTNVNVLTKVKNVDTESINILCLLWPESLEIQCVNFEGYVGKNISLSNDNKIYISKELSFHATSSDFLILISFEP